MKQNHTKYTGLTNYSQQKYTALLKNTVCLKQLYRCCKYIYIYIKKKVSTTSGRTTLNYIYQTDSD